MTHKGIAKLKKRILECGGQRFGQSDFDLAIDQTAVTINKLLKDGKCIDGESRLVKKNMISRRCHENAVCFVEEHPDDYEVCTGFALSENGTWEIHSWARERKFWVNQDRPDAIIETTVKRKRYFGVCGDAQAIGLEEGGWSR